MIEIIGIGPGDVMYLTYEAMQKISRAQHIFGTERQLQSARLCLETLEQKGIEITWHTYDGKLSHLYMQLNRVLKSADTLSILASGDPNYYGILQWVKREFPEEKVASILGISSAQCLFNQTALPMHDVFMTSVHGRDPNFDLWRQLPKVCVLTDRKWDPYTLAKHYLERGLNPLFYIGERLTYPTERITVCSANDVEERTYTLCVLVIDHER